MGNFEKSSKAMDSRRNHKSSSKYSSPYRLERDAYLDNLHNAVPIKSINSTILDGHNEMYYRFSARSSVPAKTSADFVSGRYSFDNASSNRNSRYWRERLNARYLTSALN